MSSDKLKHRTVRALIVIFIKSSAVVKGKLLPILTKIEADY